MFCSPQTWGGTGIKAKNSPADVKPSGARPSPKRSLISQAPLLLWLKQAPLEHNPFNRAGRGADFGSAATLAQERLSEVRRFHIFN